jgi:hypothetical protein
MIIPCTALFPFCPGPVLGFPEKPKPILHSATTSYILSAKKTSPVLAVPNPFLPPHQQALSWTPLPPPPQEPLLSCSRALPKASQALLLCVTLATSHMEEGTICLSRQFAPLRQTWCIMSLHLCRSVWNMIRGKFSFEMSYKKHKDE